MKTADLRKLSDADLLAKIEDSKKELFNLRFRRVTDVIENPRLPRELRRDIAKIKTIMSQRKLGIGPKQQTPAVAT